MPKFLRDSPGFVLVDVQKGKRYIGDPQVHRRQSAQKGNTCALYAFNPFRFRFGKNYPNSKEREIELIFSAYRRGINDIERNVATTYKDILEEINDALENSNENPINVDDVRKYLLILDGNLEDIKKLSTDTKKIAKQIIKYKQICHEFIKNEFAYDDFQEFIEQKENIDWVNLAKETIKRLTIFTNLDVQTVFNNYLTAKIKSVINPQDNYGENIDLTLGNPEFMAPLYHQAVINLAASCFQLEEATWDPTIAIDNLMDTLRESGPLVIYTEPCVLFNKANCQIEEETENYQIYANKVQNNNLDGCHSLVIIGAQSCPEGKNLVYVLDPNISNELNGPSQIYAISYEELLNKILNVYGVSLQEEAEKIRGPFAFQARNGNFDVLYEFVNNGMQSEPHLVNSKKNKVRGDDAKLPEEKFIKITNAPQDKDTKSLSLTNVIPL